MTDKNLSELISSSYNGVNLIDDTANTTANIWTAVKISNELNSIVIPDTDLSLLANGSAIELQSSTGNNVTILSANSSTAGLLSAEAQTIAGDKTFTGTITYSSTLDSNLIPDLDITYDLGSANNRWRDLYLSGNTINLGDAQIKSDETTGTIALIPPVTASNPHPKAMVLNSLGRMQMLDTTAGVLSSQAVEETANTEDNIFESVTVTGHVNANTFIGDGSAVTNVDAVTLQGNTVADLRQYADNAAANVSVDLTGYATETYVSNAVSGLVDSAPTTLDTLNELAAALGDDPNFATTVTNLIGTKLNANTWTNSTASSIDGTDVSNWNTAYGWGDHAGAGYLTSFTESDPTVPAHVKSITSTNVSNWNTAYGWGNHASAGYQAAASAITTSNIGSQSVNYAASAGSVAWNNVTSKPSTFTPSSHTHSISNITDLIEGTSFNGTYPIIHHIEGTRLFTNSGLQFTGSENKLSVSGRVDAPIFYDQNNTGYYLDPSSTTSGNLRGNLLFGDYGVGVVGRYSASRYQAVFSMGNAYKLTTDGTGVGTLYGIAWSHPNAGGVASNLASHGMLILNNGVFNGAWGGGRLVTTSDIRGTIYYDYNNTGYYADPASTSKFNTIDLEGTIRHNGDTNTYMQFHASDQWRLVIGGIERLEVNNSQLLTSCQIRCTSNITAYYSDERLKTFHGKIDSPLEKLSKISGYYFTENEKAKELGYDNDEMQIGVNAQEVQKVFPEVIAIAPISYKDGVDEEYLTVHYDKLVPVLIEGIKEQQSTITSLEDRINKLENLLEKLI